MTALNRFWSKVEKTDGCWIWTAYRDRAGYGRFLFNGSVGAAHRFAYEMFVGALMPGMTIDHLCRTPWCVNPAHLEQVTNHENLMRGLPGEKARRTHCKWGHPRTEETTYRLKGPKGFVVSTYCRICARESRRRSNAKKHMYPSIAAFGWKAS
jgi:hypothetical protein